MVVLVYVGKEFIRWRLGGRSRHIFNPSAFALAVASLALIATGTTGITQGVEIAQSQYVPPFIFVVIFLAALPGQLLFGVATMTMPAVLTIWGFSAGYLADHRRVLLLRRLHPDRRVPRAAPALHGSGDLTQVRTRPRPLRGTLRHRSRRQRLRR